MLLSPETVAHVRQQYADEVPIRDIMAEHKISRNTLYRCVDGRIPGAPLPPLPRRVRRCARRRMSSVGRARKALVARLWRTANRQVRDIELRIAGSAEREPPERERDARMLAVLVKTLRELSVLDEAERDAAAGKDTGRDDDDAIPRDLDDLRRELARRVDTIRQRRAAAGAPERDQS